MYDSFKYFINVLVSDGNHNFTGVDRRHDITLSVVEFLIIIVIVLMFSKGIV